MKYLINIFIIVLLFNWMQLGIADVSADAYVKPVVPTSSTGSTTSTTTTNSANSSPNTTTHNKSQQESIDEFFKKAKYEDFTEQKENHPFNIP